MPLDQGLLKGTQSREWVIAKPPTGAIPQWVYTGRDESGLGPIYVALAAISAPPSRETMRALHAAYKGKSNIQLVVGAVLGNQVWIFGPDEKTEVTEPLALDQGCRQLQSALDEPDAIAAYTRLGQFRRSLDTTSLVGVTNSGLFASYHIRENVPKRNDWKESCEKAKPLLALRNEHLIKALGFKSEKTAGNALLLTTGTPQSKAVAILLDETEQFDATSARHTGISPVAFGLNIAARQGVPWLFVLRKDQIRIYPAKDGVGVGQKGQVETYLEIDLAAIDSERAGLLTLIFSADALELNGTANDLLQGSQLFASQLGSRLRERIYEHVVPQLSKSVAEHLRDQGTKLDSLGLSLAYRLTLRILFRLLFQAYAEDRGLLPAGRNEGYDANSLKTIAKRIINIPAEQFGKSKTLWFDLAQVWNAIDEGNETWNVPAYNGGLFGTDPDANPEGAIIENLGIQDDVLGSVLQHLLLDVSEDGVIGPVDFRSLSVREFGTIYEGLLESSLSVATQDLTVDNKGSWIPAQEADLILAVSGDVYFHSASGERKATGSFFTPSIVVDHLIERTLNPALEKHLIRIKTHLDSGDQASAARDFFDFRIADLAMGSGHFLVAAIDRIEAKMRTFLAEKETQVPGVNAELHRLAEAAKAALGKDESAIGEIEPAALLRRQIARRCIYGMDINPLAVELSRLAIWIHTFVPGLPMSSLDHGLVCANSLTGVGTIEEALKSLQPDDAMGQISIYEGAIIENLEKASELLIEVANSDEAKKAEVKASAKAAKLARIAAEPAREIFNAAIAAKLKLIDPRSIFDQETLIALSREPKVIESMQGLNPGHLPFLFPEVFVRENPGFDVLLGNPPWKDIVFDEPRFWGSQVPGLMSMKVQDRTQVINDLREKRPDLVTELDKRKAEYDQLRSFFNVAYDIGEGDADLYQPFCWRLWSLIRKNGLIGIVLPKTAFSAAGMGPWRKQVLEEGSITDLVFIVNSGRWAFDIEPRYSVAFACLEKSADTDLRISGPFQSREEFISGKSDPVVISKKAILNFTTNVSIPMLANQEDADILTQMRKSPRLEDVENGCFKLVREFDATLDRKYFDHPMKESSIPVYAGDSFNIWNSSTGSIFAHADPILASKKLHEKFINQKKLKSSAFFGMDLDRDLGGVLPFERTRIAYRSVSRGTDSRTIIASLIPANVILTNISPYILTTVNNEKNEAKLLGILSSVIFDFYARKFIETAVNNHFLNAFPIPDLTNSQLIEKLISNVLSLVDDIPEFKKWKEKVGTKPTLFEEVDNLISENDAIVARLYGLNEKQLIHIFTNFHRGWDYSTRLKLTLEYFGKQK
jgi:hypothetical protein